MQVGQLQHLTDGPRLAVLTQPLRTGDFKRVQTALAASQRHQVYHPPFIAVQLAVGVQDGGVVQRQIDRVAAVKGPGPAQVRRGQGPVAQGHLLQIAQI